MSCFLVGAIAISAHMGLNADYNAFHPAIKCDQSDKGFIAGMYLNSEENLSLYGGWKTTNKNDVWVEIGIVSGYSSYDILPFARLGYDVTQKTSIFVAPAIELDQYEKETVGVVLGLEIKIQK